MSATYLRQYPVGCRSTTTRVLEAGSGGIPLVLLHGVGARADRWRPAMRAFAGQGRHCFAFDLPGHGLAGKPAGFDYSVPGYTDFTEELLDELGLDEVVLVGTSLGGHIAGAATARRPARVRALVLVGPMGLLRMAQDVLDALAASILDRSRAGVAGKLNRLLVDKSLISSDWVEEEVRINNSPGADDAFTALSTYFRDQINHDTVADALRQLTSTVPTLLVWGAEDTMVPTSLAVPAREAIGEHVPLIYIPNTGHAPYLEAANRFVGHVSDFLGDVKQPVPTARGGIPNECNS